MIEVHLYKFTNLLPRLDDFKKCLSMDELVKANRFIDPKKGSHSIISRGLLRQHLSQQLNVSPKDLEFEYGRYGKPTLKSTPHLHFNVSHSENMCAVIISTQGNVGIDIELINKNKNVDKLSSRVFTPAESEQFSQINNQEDKFNYFFNTWTQKEAITKCDGVGMVRPFTEIDVENYNVVTTIISGYSLSYCHLTSLSDDDISVVSH